MEDSSSTENSECESDLNSASELEDDDVPQPYESHVPKTRVYQGRCVQPDGSNNRPRQLVRLQLHPITIDELDVPLSPGVFFKLFFTSELVASICGLTNSFAESQRELKPSIYENWFPLSPEEFYRFLALLLYITSINLPRITAYWSEYWLLVGLWSHKVMSKHRYRQIQAFLRVSEPVPEREEVDFSEIDAVYDFIREKCMRLWEPHEREAKRGLPLDRVNDNVEVFVEERDIRVRNSQGKTKKKISINAKCYHTLEGFGEIYGVQWKDARLACAAIIMHKDLHRGRLAFLRYKHVYTSGGIRDPGFDITGALVVENDVLVSSTRSWKAVLYHLVDVAWLTAYFMFEQYRTEPEQAFNPHVARLSKYEATDFKKDLMKELAALPSDSLDNEFNCTELVPYRRSTEERCARCVQVDKIVRMTNSKCLMCQEYFCYSPQRKCLALVHNKEKVVFPPLPRGRRSSRNLPPETHRQLRAFNSFMIIFVCALAMLAYYIYL